VPDGAIGAAPARDLVWIPGGTFTMGSDAHEPEEAPAHPVTVDGFWLQRHPVTNEEFGAFVDATGYRTVAERPLDPRQFPGLSHEQLQPGSMVFTPTSGPVDLGDLRQWWEWRAGAYWRRPEGRGSNLKRREGHPVVHVAYEDAAAYATWASRTLPTEAEWERAARGGIEEAAYTWGDEERPGGRLMANTWDGPDFPWRHTAESGFEGTSPVGSFPANGYGLHDMAGNVWEWTDDWWTRRHPVAVDTTCCAPANPRGGTAAESLDRRQPDHPIPRKVIKGGSHLCSPTYCLRYRPAARRPQMIDTGMSHLGFRCVQRPPEAT
jgi:formylglycine-generating enzyme required for sulfatase activity